MILIVNNAKEVIIAVENNIMVGSMESRGKVLNFLINFKMKIHHTK